jgi:hypothetical protein
VASQRRPGRASAPPAGRGSPLTRTSPSEGSCVVQGPCARTARSARKSSSVSPLRWHATTPQPPAFAEATAAVAAYGNHADRQRGTVDEP